MITEPMTMATDYVLAVAAWIFSIRLFSRSRLEVSRPKLLWSLAFFFTGVAAAAGGTFHGFTQSLSPSILSVLWKVTCYALGMGSLALLCGIADAVLSRRWTLLVSGAAVLKFLIYGIQLGTRDDFRIVVTDYAISMVAVLVIACIDWMQRKSTAAVWIVGGVLVSFVAAAIQASGLTMHQHFNHNDLYHLVQIGGLWLLYRGGMKMRRK